ncbi:GNAT family N-acetyltransferase [Pseudoflavitalea sp. G-6-1-2]|uniref:GNAT family N-acetyltransferase n=1 Tax=Pseudoflavitalea sp. G-6-1-2 TaxID=2728841 RepID=UPI00146A0A9E|nr:GNAT family N-acetyltransferase [Pseudoflavitalea sp. G-6-1-2]NML23405.1 GNAT family N-acetyltransferase [Pseudoflavitalea sp. G-6-1-2]
MAIITTTVSSEKELEQILQLQQQNLRYNISAETSQSQGFVSLSHSLSDLQKLHEASPSIIAKDGDIMAGYALTQTRECRYLMSDLEPMFALLDEVSWKGKSLRDSKFYVMGQICVAEAYRGQGVFDKLYQQHKITYGASFDCIVTEIATRNLRSMRAHERVGFKIIHTHLDELDEWAVVAWDWS